MGQYTKSFFDGQVQSFDGRTYQMSMPDSQTAILKYSTVHKYCDYPESMMEDGHLKVGTVIRLCKIIKNDKVSILPDHRFYYSNAGPKELTDCNATPSGSIDEFMYLLVAAGKREEFTDAVKEAMKLFALGFASAAIILLSTLLNINLKQK